MVWNCTKAESVCSSRAPSHRSDYNDSEVADGIKDTITLFADKSEKEVKEIRKRAADVAEQALWKHFIQYYYEAYDIALRNALKRQLS